MSQCLTLSRLIVPAARVERPIGAANVSASRQTCAWRPAASIPRGQEIPPTAGSGWHLGHALQEAAGHGAHVLCDRRSLVHRRSLWLESVAVTECCVLHRKHATRPARLSVARDGAALEAEYQVKRTRRTRRFRVANCGSFELHALGAWLPPSPVCRQAGRNHRSQVSRFLIPVDRPPTLCEELRFLKIVTGKPLLDPSERRLCLVVGSGGIIAFVVGRSDDHLESAQGGIDAIEMQPCISCLPLHARMMEGHFARQACCG